jgi:hypothetical protein
MGHPPQQQHYQKPKFAYDQSAQQNFTFDSPSSNSQSNQYSQNTPPPRNSHQGFSQYTNGGMGMGHMLERTHNVVDRSMVPQKRPKLYNNGVGDERRKATFNGGTNGSMLGQYVRDKLEEARKTNPPAVTAVDLTAG